MNRISAFFLLALLAACGGSPAGHPGERLARQHCGGCHRFPEPGLLDKSTWSQNVLPSMALRLGLTPASPRSVKVQDQYFHLTEHGLYPDQPQLSASEWAAIRAFYLSLAPDSLPRYSLAWPMSDRFVRQDPGLAQTTGPLPATTSLSYHPATNAMLAGVYGSGQVFIARDGHAPKPLMRAPSMLVHATPFPSDSLERYLLTFLGPVIRPDATAAGVCGVATLKNSSLDTFQLLPLPLLHRPTQGWPLNLDNDPETEILVCEFGYLTGMLSYWDADDHGGYSRKIIREEPGALQALPMDANADSHTDLMVLFAHGDERLSLFTADGQGGFDEKVLRRFPAGHGSSSFDLIDLDGDGLKDILYTCGDNADLSPVVKPYHGVYVFRNLGNMQFEEAFHQPMPGAYRAVARDFDRDGDQDIAAVAFFVDPGPPESPGFLYLEQGERSLAFRPHTKELDRLGRWITLDAGDMDGDGDEDLILGNAYGLSGLDMIGEAKPDATSPWLCLINTLQQSER